MAGIHVQHFKIFTLPSYSTPGTFLEVNLQTILDHMQNFGTIHAKLIWVQTQRKEVLYYRNTTLFIFIMT